MPFVHPIAFCFYILFLFVAPATIRAQGDSTKLVIYTDGLNRDTLSDPKADTLPQFSKRVTSSFQENLANEGSERIFLQARHPDFTIFGSTFFIQEHQHLYYYSVKPLTVASYVLASNKEQVFRILHNQDIRKGLHFYIGYNKVRSEGFYQHQLSDKDEISFGMRINGSDKRYQAVFTGQFTDRYREENGGLDDTLFQVREYTNNKLYNVAIKDGISRHRNWSGEFRHKLYLDQQRKFSAEHHFRYDYRGFSYTGQAQNTYFDNIHLDSVNTQDHSFSESYRNMLLLRRKNQSWNLSAGAGWIKTAYKGEGIGLEEDLFFIKAAAIYTTESTELNAGGEWYLNGYHSGDFKTEFSYRKTIRKGNSKVQFRGIVQRNSPYLNAIYYLSNHYFWTGVYKPAQHYLAELSYSLNKERIRFTAFGNGAENGLYLDSLSLFRQHSAFALVTGIKMDVLFSLTKHIHFKGNFLTQFAKENPIYRIPVFAVNSSIYYSGKAWSMKYLTGFHFNYNTSYYGNAFNPALNAFYYQQNTLVGNYPMLDVFFETRINTVDVFLAVHHVAESLFGRNYYNAPDYPMTDRLFRFGIKWTFIN